MSAATLLFRNIDFDPSAELDTWPTEAFATALERGSLTHWSRIATAIQGDPWGPVARTVEDVLACSRPFGVAVGMERLIANARARREVAEKQAVAAELRAALTRSHLSAGQFASRLGTSPSRLSTYLSGKVTPSATVLVRARHI